MAKILGRSLPSLRGVLVVTCLLAALPVGRGLATETNITARHGPLASGQYQPAPRGPWCGDHKLGQLTQAQRLEGSNLDRLRAAQAELAPGFEAGTAKTELYLLADYQEELEKRQPDPTLAATYLALTSTVPITAARYLQVNALLCVSTTRAIAKEIETTAETLRQHGSAPTPQNKGGEQ